MTVEELLKKDMDDFLYRCTIEQQYRIAGLDQTQAAEAAERHIQMNLQRLQREAMLDQAFEEALSRP